MPGGWGVGKKLKNVSFLGHFFLNFSKKNEKKLTKSVKFARIGLILIQNDSPHRVLDSWGGFGNFFANFRKMKKFDEIGQIRSDWAHIENPDSRDRVLDSPGGFGQFFRKIGGK